MKAVIFGITGQDGYYLSSFLKEKGGEVIGVGKTDPVIKLSDYETIASLVRQTQPACIFHLAARSSTRHEALFENHETIDTGTLHILEAVKNHSPATKVFISGSGLQFKNAGQPIKETDPFEARDPYSVSRIASVYTARYYRSLGIRAYVGYFFNHDSPLRSEQHMSKKIAEAAKRAGRGGTEKLEIGDLDAVKEYGFAGDIVKGIWTLVNQEAVMEANIATGKGYSIRDWLQACYGHVGKNWTDFVAVNTAFKPDYRQLVADPSTLFALGWKPETGFEQLAAIMMHA